jgi:uncharacterized SAM-dependent methyltransferase
MNIEVLLTELEIANEFSESLEARDLPEKFFYWFPLSVRSWRALAAEPLFTGLQKVWAAVSERLPRALAHFDGSVPVLSFGAGDGERDRVVLRGLRKASKDTRYFPVDASQTLLEIACAAAEDEEFETVGIKADISSRMHLLLAADAAEAPRLFLMAGNTLGGFDPLDQIKNLSDAMRPGDLLVIDGALDTQTGDPLPQSETEMQFAFAPLATIGISAEDGRVRFEQKRDSRHPGLLMIAKHFQADRDVRISVASQDLAIARGERIFMNFRYQYSAAAFRWLIEDHAGLKIEESIESDDHRFIAAICSK